MKAQKRLVWIFSATLVLLGTSGPQAAEVTNAFRLSPIGVEPGFSGNYLKDAAIVGHHEFRGEFSGQSYPRFEGIEVRRYNFLASYSLIENTEIGVDVPYYELVPGGGVSQEDGIGDVSVYGKYQHRPTDNLSVTGGFELQLESSDYNKKVPCGAAGGRCHLGFNEHGYNPFVAVRYAADNWAAGGHFGFEMFDDPLGDVINYDVHGIVRLTDNLGLRLELTGFNQAKGCSRDIVSIAPGFDLAFGSLVFRAAGFKGITDDAADWGLGGGVALTFGGVAAESAEGAEEPL